MASMGPETQAWFRQAEADLLAARDSLTGSHYEWTCFQAQQCAEKALKAFLLEKGVNPEQVRRLRHSLHGPGSALEVCVSIEPQFVALDKAVYTLDQHSIAPRYPDAVTLPGGVAPTEYYGISTAQDCISAASSTLNFVTQLIK